MSSGYKHLGRVVMAKFTGARGVIVNATPSQENKKRGCYDVEVQWPNGRKDSVWREFEIGDGSSRRHLLILKPDDWQPDYGPRLERIKALLARLDGPIPYKRDHSTEIMIGRDSVGCSRWFGEWKVSAYLWGEEGRWDSVTSRDQATAVADLKRQLQEEFPADSSWALKFAQKAIENTKRREAMRHG